MALTKVQIDLIRKRAKERGLSEQEISQGIARLNQQSVRQDVTPQQPQQTGGVSSVSGMGGSQPQQTGGLVGSFFKSLYQPFESVGQTVAEAQNVIRTPGMVKSALGGKLNEREQAAVAGYKPRYLKEEDLTREGLRKRVTKQTLGVMSYGVPFGKGAGIVTKALLPGAASAGMLEASQEDATTGSVAKSAAGGALTAGALNVAGKVLQPVIQKAGRGLTKAGGKIAISRYVKEMGVKPINREGGAKLLTKMQKMGFKPGSADDILQQADDVILDNSGKILEATQQVNRKIPVSKLVKVLQDQIKSAKSTVTKKPLQEVLDIIKKDVGKRTSLSAEELYLLKTEYGSLGSWTSLSSAIEKKQAEAWRDVYIAANDLIDEALSKGGFKEFRAINEMVHTAMQARQYASRVANVAPNKNTLGLLDVVSGVGGFGAFGANPLAIIGSILGRRAMEGPGSAIVGKTLQKGGGTMAKATGEALGPMVQKAGALGAGALTGADLVSGTNDLENKDNYTDQTTEQNAFNEGQDHDSTIQQEVKQEQPKPFGGRSKQELLQLALAQGAELKDLKEIAEIYDMITGMEEDKEVSKYAPAVSRSLKQLEKISGIGTTGSIYQGASGTIAKKLKGAQAEAKKATDEGFAKKVNEYSSAQNLVIGAINQLLGAGVLNEDEARRLIDTMPDEKTSEAEATSWFENARIILGVE